MKAVTMCLSRQGKMGINMNILHYICLALLKSQSVCVLVDQSLQEELKLCRCCSVSGGTSVFLSGGLQPLFPPLEHAGLIQAHSQCHHVHLGHPGMSHPTAFTWPSPRFSSWCGQAGVLHTCCTCILNGRPRVRSPQ